MNDSLHVELDNSRPRPWCGWLSLLMSLVPVLFLAFLILGGGRSGFATWNDVRDLLVLMIVCALLGTVLFVLSFRRDEQSVASYFAVLLHGIYFFAAIWAFQQ